MGPREASPCAAVAVHQPLIRKGLLDLATDAGFDAQSHDIFDFNSLLVFLGRMPVLALVVLCLALPGMHGVQGIQRLRTRFPSQPVLIIVHNVRRDTIVDIISAGADGVVSLSTDPDAMVQAMITVSSGSMYIPRYVAGNASLTDDDMASSDVAAVPDLTASLASLTERQRQVLRWLAIGESNKRIARRLDISPHTVNMHIRAVFRALGVHCRVEAVNILTALSLKDGAATPEALRRHGDIDNASGSDQPSFRFF